MNPRLRPLFTALLLAAVALSVMARQPLDYADTALWHNVWRDAPADVFYVASTETVDWTDPQGMVRHQADLGNPLHVKNIMREIMAIDRRLAGELNFFAPLYRQATLQVWASPALIDTVLPDAFTDVRDAFLYYIRHLNHGRPIVLAGFSQGGFAVLDLLKSMPDSVVSRVVATYVIGAAVTQADIDAAPTRIVPAQGPTDTGVVVSYNSVRSPDCLIPTVSGGTVVCINPVNWRTDNTSAPLDTLTVRCDPRSHHLIVTGISDEVDRKYRLPLLGKPGNYHTLEIRYFTPQLRQNIADRVRAFLSSGITLPWPRNVQARLDSITQSPLLQTSQLGLMVWDLTADSALYAVGERQTLRPASTQKLLTAITALDVLGPRHPIRTSLYIEGNIADGTLMGDLILQGQMDPAFSDDDLQQMVWKLRQLGVDTIRGRLVCDKSFKQSDLLGEGWCWDDDNPELSPLVFARRDQMAERLVQALRSDGATVDVEFADGAVPRQATLVAQCSHTLSDLLDRMLKDSDNLYAEAVFYHIASAAGQRPATAAAARQAEQKLISRIGLNPDACRVADGSGLSLYNYTSAQLQVRLLRYAWLTPAVRLSLVPALPVASVDGTLKKRMAGTWAEQNVRAKTGTLSGVSSLAGYCTAANGHQLCFSIINQGVMRSADGRAFQDRVCTALCTP